MSRNKDFVPRSEPKDYDRQERLIEEKRKIFLAKKAGPIPPTPAPNISNSKPKQTTNSAEKLPFANDGSFYAQFLQMKTPASPEVPLPAHPPISIPSPVPSNLPSDARPLPPSPLPLPSPPPVKLKLAPTPQPDHLTAPMPIFLTEEAARKTRSETEEKVSEFELAERMARQLAQVGEEAIKSFKSKEYRQGPLQFLSDPSHPANVYFRQKLLEHQRNDKRVQPTADSVAVSAPRRKTRWSSESDVVRPPPSLLSTPQQSGPDQTPEQKRQLEVQTVLNKIADSIRGRGGGMKRFTTGPRFEYDSEEENESGTWEHKRRAVEMEKTRESAEILTELGKGKHHLSDYLPGDEYLRFMTEVEKAKAGEQLTTEDDYKDNEIKQDNIGYKMLQRAGWQEGQGLGAQQQGITAPVNKGRSSLDVTGIGSDMTKDIKSNDDEFSLYRKRMMLAYKFRPNPLNNPRRPYYD